MFAVEYGTECFTAENAEETYQKFGESTGCSGDGTGGKWAMNVYRIIHCIDQTAGKTHVLSLL